MADQTLKMISQLTFLSCILMILGPVATQAQISSSTCGPKFPDSCTCGREMYEATLQYVVNCTNAGLTNTSVLAFMPDEVQILIFTGNFIPELPWNVFGTINDYKYLEIIDMSNNHIRDIRGKSYHHVQNVKRLILNHNNLSISRNEDEVNHHHARVFSNFLHLESLHLTDAFADNTSPKLSEDLHDIFVNSDLRLLQKLHLEQNEITHFKDRKVFCDLPSLRDLHLGDNLLQDINFDIACLKNLRFLDLERNKFEYVKPNDMMSLNDLQHEHNNTIQLIVDFNLNPFVCDCHLSPFYMWLMATKVIVRNRENLVCVKNHQDRLPILQLDILHDCASAAAAAQVLFTTASDYHYDKSEYEPHFNNHTATLIFLLIVLTMILVALLVALVYVSRDKLKLMFTPVFDNVAKKVQYTTIQDEDCPEVHV